MLIQNTFINLDYVIAFKKIGVFDLEILTVKDKFNFTFDTEEKINLILNRIEHRLLIKEQLPEKIDVTCEDFMRWTRS